MLSAKKRKAQERVKQREADWQASIMKKFGGITSKPVSSVAIPSYSHRSTGEEHFRPAIAVAMDYAAKKASPQYTGDAIVGLATLHKSNTVPVFSQQDAIDVARMRRG